MKSTSFIAVLVGLFISGVFFAGNLRYARANPGGTDFLVHWVAARHVLQQGESPYSEAVVREIQQRIYGRPARPGEHEQRVVYPLYSVAVFAPFAILDDYVVARALWMTVLELALLGALLVELRLVGWQPDRLTLVLLMLFGLGWYHSVRTVINGNVIGLLTLVFALVAYAIYQEQDGWGGFLLAWVTIKPNVALLPFLFVVLWGVSRRRWRLVGYAVGGVLGLLAAATIWHPAWWVEYLRELVRFPTYNPPGTLQAVLREVFPVGGMLLGWGVTVVLGLVWLWAVWAAWNRPFAWFLWTFHLTLVVSQWIGIRTDPGNFVVLLLPLVHALALWQRRWQQGGLWLARMTLIGLGVGLWWLFLRTLVVVYGQPLQSDWMFIPVPLVTLLGLFWVRWWAVNASTWDRLNAA